MPAKIKYDEKVIARAFRMIEQRAAETIGSYEGTKIHGTHTAKQLAVLDLATEEREIFAVAYLTTRHELIEWRRMFYGTINACTVHVREVVKHALKVNAAAVVLAHNHPSGNPDPSPSDEALTREMATALRVIGVNVLDHVVVAGSCSLSMAERGLL